MSDDDFPDDFDFSDSMRDVAPHKSARRVGLSRGSLASPENEPGVQARRKAAQALKEETRDPLSGDFIEPVDPAALLEFKRPGLQTNVYRNFRLGKYTIDARLDLHGLTVAQARVEIVGFIDECMQHDIRCVLINHGKGFDRQPQPGLLKSCVAHWLPQLPAVMAYHSAQKHHGGVGATYVMLRKSEKKRLENQLQQQSGREK